MGSREPLSGWEPTAHGRYRVFSRRGVELWAMDGSWDVDIAAELSGMAKPGELPVYAAEDAARAMVADMAAALGGSVTWGESEASDG